MKHNPIKQSILAAAIKLAVLKGYNKISRDEIAAEAVCTPSLISYHFGTMTKLRRAILGEAKRLQIITVIEQGERALESRCRR